MQSLKKPEWFFSIVIFIIGLCLLVITPMGANTDEETYVARIWEISLGHFVPNSLLADTPIFPNAFFENSFRRNVNLPTINFEEWKREASIYINFKDFMPSYTTRAVYFPTLYGVQAIVMGITGRLFDFPIMVIYYCIRFSYLVMYCLLAFLSIKTIPFGKWLFGFLVSTPICIIQGAAVSSDPLIFGTTFLFIAWILFLINEPGRVFAKKQTLITCLLILALGTLKPNYILLLLLLFTFPKSFVISKGQKLAIAFSVLMSIAISIGWSSISSTYFLTRENDLLSPFLQLKFIFANPLDFLKILFMVIKNTARVYYLQSVGIAGYGYWLLPKIIYILIPIIVVLALFTNTSSVQFNKRQRVVFALTAVINMLAVLVIFYLVETPVGAARIDGVQGRYLSPFFSLLFIPFVFTMKKHNNLWIKYILVICTIFISIFSAFSLFLDYHVVCGSFWFTGEACTLPRYKNWAPDLNLSFTPSTDETLNQAMIARCNNLYQLNIWVNSNDISNPIPFTISMVDDHDNSIRTYKAISTDVVKSGWLTFGFAPIENSLGKDYQIVISSDAAPFQSTIKFGITASNEYSDGSRTINGGSQNGDLVFQYNCPVFRNN